MIGILDWGIGGFGFERALTRARPGTHVVYLSDSGFTPYGKVKAPELARRVLAAVTVLREHGATHVVIACNAASTVLPALGVTGLAGRVETRAGSVEVTGIIAHALGMLRRRRIDRVAILGGARTIRSGAYARPLRARGVQVAQRIAQPLSAHVERGDLSGPVLRADLATIAAPLRSAPTVLLACTHYAALMPQLTAALPHARLLDPVDDLTAWVLRNFDLTGAPPRGLALTTGNANAMRVAARMAFGVELGPVTKLRF